MEMVIPTFQVCVENGSKHRQSAWLLKLTHSGAPSMVGGSVLVQMVLGSDLGWGWGQSTELVDGELELSAALKTLDSGIEELCSLTPRLTPPNEM